MSALTKSEFGPWDRPASRRRYRRWAVDMPAYIDVDGNSHYCLLFDLSPAGARLRVVDQSAPAVGTRLDLDLEGYGQVPAKVRHSSGGIVGLSFLHEQADEVRLARWLIEAKPTRREARHACRIKASVRSAGFELACTVTDISRSGAAIRLDRADQLVISSEVELLLPGAAPITASVRHIDGSAVGLMLIDGYQGELPTAHAAREPEPKKARSWF